MSVGPSDMIPVSETDVGINWKIPPNMYILLGTEVNKKNTKLRVALFGGEHIVPRIQLLSSTFALFVRQRYCVALFVGFLRIELTE